MEDEYWLAEAISAKQRDTWRKQGFTLSATDDSWPIPDLGFLEKAISSWGRAVAAGNAAQVKRHMLKRARALGASKDKIKQIQALGTSTAEAEASLEQQSDRVRDAWRSYCKAQGPMYGDWDTWVNEVYADHVIVKLGEDYWSIPYSEDDDGEFAFDKEAATKVERTWVGVEAEGEEWLICPVAEAKDAEPDGSRWQVTIIKAGTSKNGRRYAPAVLKEAAPLFEGARVLARADEDHISGSGKSVTNIVGWLSDVAFARGAIRGTFNVSEAAAWLRTMLLDAWRRGKRDLVGLSIVAEGTGKDVVSGGKRVFEVEAITRVSSVDVVFDPAAGGGLVKLVAAMEKEGPMDLQKFIELLREASPTVAKELLSNADTELTDALREAAPELLEKIEQAKAPVPTPAKTEPTKIAEGDPGPDPEPEDLVSAPISRFVVKDALGETKLPEVVKARISKRFVGKAFREADLSEAIKDELDSWAELERDNLVTSAGRSKPDISVGVEEVQRAKAALDGFFLGESVEVDGEKVPAYRSFKNAYMDLTGDGLETGGVLTGRLPRRPAGKLGISEANGGLVSIRLHELAEGEMVLSEAIATTGFTEILGDSVARRMVADYTASNLMTWASLVDVVPVTDFRTQRRMRFGGYANLAAVAQGAAYAAMTSPTDEEATYAATKRGGTETINLEAIANDDVGFIRRVPSRMARAAAQTLHEFVFEFLNSNAAIYDAVALFAAGHSNIGTVALSTSSLSSALQRMRKQADMTSTKRLGLVGRHLWVPIELEETAFVLTASERKQGTADNDASFVRQKGIDYEVVDYWTDANNWYLSAEKSDVPIIEMGFYGPEEPEIFSQDLPNVGSMFTNDQVTLKIRHIYSGTVLDFRGVDGSLVA